MAHMHPRAMCIITIYLCFNGQRGTGPLRDSVTPLSATKLTSCDPHGPEKSTRLFRRQPALSKERVG